jgi:transposase InsO family protein
LLSMSLSPCCRFHPAEVEMPHRSDFGIPCCLRPPEAGSALGSRPFETTFTFTVITARQLVVSPRETLSIGFRILISLHPAIRTTGRLTFSPAGLPPAEHTSLNWTHFRTIIASGRVEPLTLPARSPNLNAYAGRWVRSVKEECLSKIILFGERSLRRALCEYVEHYHAEAGKSWMSPVRPVSSCVCAMTTKIADKCTSGLSPNFASATGR